MKYQDLTAGFIQAQNSPNNIAGAISKALGYSWATVAIALFAVNPMIQFNKAGEPCLEAKGRRALLSTIEMQKTAFRTTALMPLSLN